MFDDVLNRCIERWHCEDIPLSPPIDPIEIHRVWNRFGQPVSRDVLQLYSTVGGFANWASDGDFFWYFWPWNVLRKENSESPSRGIQFCDHSIGIVTWELRFETDSHSSVWVLPPIESRKEPEWLHSSRQAAANLESFFQKYLDDPWQLM